LQFKLLSLVLGVGLTYLESFACRIKKSEDQNEVLGKEDGMVVQEPKVMDKADGEGFQRRIFQEFTNCNIVSVIINTSKDHGSKTITSRKAGLL
jgi:hypothetical protein